MKLRSHLLTVGRYALGSIALGWVVLQVEWNRVGNALVGISWEMALALLVITIAGLASRFYTWHVLLTHVGTATFRSAIDIDLSINFVNQLFPSRVSGRSLAPLVVRQRSGHPWPAAVAVTTAHTGLYAALYGIVAVLGLAVSFRRLPGTLAALIGVATGLYLAVGAVLLVAGMRLELMGGLTGGLRVIARRVPAFGGRLVGIIEKFPEFAETSSDVFRRTLSALPVGKYTLGWLVALVLAPGVRVVLLLSALGYVFEPVVLLPLVLVAAYSITVLPLTPGGIGITEVTATAVFVALGVPTDVIVPAVFIDRFLGVYLPALVGWYPAMRLDLDAYGV